MAHRESDISEEFLLRACRIRKEYNRAREELNRQMTGYYRQAIASSYYKEEDLKSQLDVCAELKKKYNEVCDILKENGIRPVPTGNWTSEGNSILFVKP